MALSLTACTSTSSVAVKSFETNTSTSMKMSYGKLTGSKTRTFTLDNSGTTEMNVDIKTDSGKINLSVKGKDGKSFYSGTELPTSSFQVKLDGAGKYEINIRCDDHKGGYDITWVQPSDPSVAEPADSPDEACDIKTDSGRYAGRADSNFIEINISGVPEEKTGKVFMLTEELKSNFDGLVLETGDTIKFDYYVNDKEQNVIVSIEKNQ